MDTTKRNFFILYAGQAVSQLTSSILQMAIVWYLLFRGESASVIALSGIMGFLPQGIIGLLIGEYIDRHSRKKIMIFSDLMIACFSLLLVLQGLSGSISTGLILFVLAMRSIGTAFHQPSLGATIPLIVPQEELTKYSGYAQGLQAVSLLLSPALAAALFAVWDLQFIIALDCIGALFAIICLLFTAIPQNTLNTTSSRKTETNPFSGINVLKDYHLIHFCLISALYSCIYTPIFVLYPMMSINYFNKSQWHAGLVEFLFAIGMMFGAFLLSKIKIITCKITWVGYSALGIAASVLLSGVLPPSGFMAFSILSILLGLFSPFYQGIQSVVLQEKIPNKFLGRALSSFAAVTVLGTPIGIGISGTVTDKIGIAPYFLLSGILLLIVSLLFFSLKRIQTGHPK